MAKKATNDIRQWARLGAEQRLVELQREIAAIHATFPGLRRGARTPGAAAPAPHAAAPAATPKKRRRRRKMSAEARKRISDAQKARWAKHRTGK
ncbi:MAG TPA: hypothetical protein VGI12_06885 [Vicinamibacterales bacterium]